MPTLYRAQLHLEEKAGSITKTCANCRNTADWQLHFAKEGAGIGVPIVSMFTDKAVLARKKFYLVCPVCSNAESVTRDFAAGLMRKGG